MPPVNPLPRYWQSLDADRPVSTLFRLLGEVLLAISLLGWCANAFDLANVYFIWVDPKQVELAYKSAGDHWLLTCVLLAPFLETVLCQWLPFEIARRFTKSFWPPFFISWFLFAFAHFHNNFASGISAGLAGGFYFALTYSLFRPKSVWRALGATCLLHATWNFTVFSFWHQN